MSQRNIDFGSFPDDPSADAIRTAFEKVQQNFTELYTGTGAGVTSVVAGQGIELGGTGSPTGTVTIEADIACIQVQSSTLSLGVLGSSSDESYVLIPSSSQILTIDLPPTLAFEDVEITGNLEVQGNTTLGNSVTANFFLGDGGLLSNITTSGGTSITNGNSNVVVDENGNVRTSVAGISNVLTVTGTGANVFGYVDVTGNVTAANFFGRLANGTSNISIPVQNGNINLYSAGNIWLSAGNGERQILINNSLMVFYSTGTLNGRIGGAAGTFTVDAHGTNAAPSNLTLSTIYQGNIRFITNGTERMRILSTGNVGIGTSAPVGTLNVVGTANITGNVTANNLGNISSINLDSSSSNVLYGNGVFAPASGGNANTGNVTFDDVTVQGVNGLNLSAGADFTANLAYLRVRAGDVPSHIHLDTGNNDAYDLYIGDDFKYVQLSSTGNIIIGTYDSNLTTYNWKFTSNGCIALPANSAFISAESNNITFTNESYIWKFKADGTTEFPNLTTTRGDASTGTLIGETLRFDDPTNEKIITTPDGDLTYNGSQRIIINPGKGADTTVGEGGDVYLIGGKGGNGGGSGGDVRLAGGYGPSSGEGGYIEIIGGISQLGNGGQVSIRGGTSGGGLSQAGNVTISSGNSTWKFDNSGNLTLSGNTRSINFANGSSAFGNISSVNLDGNSGNVLYGNGVFAAPTGGGGGGSSITNGTSNVIVESSGNVNTSVAGNSNVFVVTGARAIVNGNLSVTGNANFGSGSGGNLTGGNVIEANTFVALLSANLGNLVTANFFQGDGGLLSNVTAGSPTSITNGSSNIQVDSNGNVRTSVAGTSNVFVVTGTGANIAGNLDLTGNVTANTISLTSASEGSITGANSIYANFFFGDGGGLSNVGGASGNQIFNGTSNVVVQSSSNITVSVAGNPNIATFTSTGEVINGVLSVTGNTTLSNMTASGVVTATGNVTGGNMLSAGTVTASRLISNVAQGTAPFAVSSNTLVANLNANLLNGNFAATANTGTTIAQRFSNGALAATAFVGNISSDSANQSNITGLGNLTSLTVTGNASAGNLSTAGRLSVTGNSNVGNLGANLLVISGNLTSGNANLGNIVVANYLSVSEDLTVVGNTTYGSGNGGNITGANVISANTLLAALSANLGNSVTANFFIGDGGFLSNISGIGTGNAITNGTSSVVVDANSDVRTSVAGVANVLVVTSSGANVTGNTALTSLGVGTAASGTSGEIRATNNITAYYSSDRRLKENVQPITDPIKKVMQLSGVTFDWTDAYIQDKGGEDGFFVRKNDIGVIAQEVQKVLPEIVAERADGMLAVKYEKMVALLLEAIKEQNTRIEKLEETIATLTGNDK